MDTTPVGITPLEKDDPNLKALLCEGKVTVSIPKEEGVWDGYVKSAKDILDDLSTEYNPIGIALVTLAMCHLIHTGFYGKENRNFPG